MLPAPQCRARETPAREDSFWPEPDTPPQRETLEGIVSYIRHNYGTLIGEPTAEAIKKQIGSAMPSSEFREMEVKGRTLAEGVPRSFTVISNEILEALTEPLNSIASAVKSALDHTHPELVPNAHRWRRVAA